VRTASVFQSDDLELILKLTLAAKGIGLVPLAIAQSHIDSGLLIHVLPSIKLKPQEINLVYLPSRRNSPKIKVFVDYVLNIFKIS
jgi:LysR family transcriptional regulator for bpeEF and oprC